VQQLEVYQSLWAMEQRQAGVAEPSLEDSFEKVAAAGFAGLGLDLAMTDVPTAMAARPLFERHGLKCLFNGFPSSDDELRFMLEMARDFGSPFLSVIGQVMPRAVEDMAVVARRWINIADEAGLPLLFETHRNGLLNDLFPTLALLNAIEDLALCADLSHFVVDREFSLPMAPDAEAMMTAVLERSCAFQGRVASNEQIQVQTGFPQHRAWTEQFERWWEFGLRSWRARSAPDAVATFLCELGPPPYAMTGPDGLELSDRWQESLAIGERVTKLWEAIDDEQTLPSPSVLTDETGR
jgi:hypothetical protein